MAKITRITARAIAEPGGRRYVVLTVETDAGVLGYGEAPAQPDPRTAAGAIERALAPFLGADPAAHPTDRRQARRLGRGRRDEHRTARTSWARRPRRRSTKRSAGRRVTRRAPWPSWRGDSTSELREAVLEAKRFGHRAFSVPVRMPAGMERGRAFFTGIRAMLDELPQRRRRRVRLCARLRRRPHAR